MQYKVSVNRRIYYEGINRKEEQKTIVHHYEADSEWKAMDLFKRDMCADAKIHGYQLYMKDTLLHELVFKADVKVYGSIKQWTVYYAFDEFKVEEVQDNEQNQSN